MANFESVTTVNRTCPGTHQHEPWGVQRRGHKRVFATALESHYPPELCDAIAHAVTSALFDQGFQPPNPAPSNMHAQAFSGVQASKAKLPPLVSEFKHRFVCVLVDTKIVLAIACS